MPSSLRTCPYRRVDAPPDLDRHDGRRDRRHRRRAAPRSTTSSAADGRRPLSDHLLARPRPRRRRRRSPRSRSRERRASSSATPSSAAINGTCDVELVVAPGPRATTRRSAAPAATRASTSSADDGGGPVHWWVFDADRRPTTRSPRRPGWRSTRELLPDAPCRCRPSTARSTSRRGRSCPGATRTRGWRSTTGRSPTTPSRAAGPRDTLRQREARAVVRPGGLPAPRARRPPRRVLLDEAPHRRRRRRSARST